MTQTSDELKALRDKIDNIDQQILLAINERAKLASDVAKIKEKASVSKEDIVFYRPEREAQVLRLIEQANQGPLPNESIVRIFREIMSFCLALERQQVIAYLGPEGTFTQSATKKHFGHGVHSDPYATISEVFREVEAGAADYGVVPVENSTEGVVNSTLDCFLTSNVHICGEVEHRIHQNLLVSSVTQRDKITRIYSHPQSFAQCRKWLDTHMPNVERIPVSSNGEAAKKVKGEWNSAAIAGVMAAEYYDLEVINENIEDNPDNTTRFLIVGNTQTSTSGNDKTSILVSTQNRPGALFDILAPFHANNLSLTRVETRPSQTSNWSYVFFIDFEGHQDDPKVAQVLAQLKDKPHQLKVLGSYPLSVV